VILDAARYCLRADFQPGKVNSNPATLSSRQNT
jgi:hypothetical protein